MFIALYTICAFLIPLVIGFILSYILFTSCIVPRIDRFVFSWISGFGIISVMVFSINQFLFWKLTQFSVGIMSLFTVLILLGFFVIRNYFFEKENTNENVFPSLQGFNDLSLFLRICFLVTIIVLLCLIFYKAIFFPVVKYEAMHYTAYIPKLIYYHREIPSQVGTSFMEVVNAYPMQFNVIVAWFYIFTDSFNDVYGRLLPPVYGIFILIITYKLSLALHRNNKMAVFSALALIGMYKFSEIMIFLNREILFVCCSLLSFYYLVLFFKSKLYRLSFIFSSGIFLGLACWTRLNGLYFAVILLFLLVALHFKGTCKLSEIMVFLIGLIALGSIIYIRNWIFFNNPIYPFFFGGKNFDEWMYNKLASRYLVYGVLSFGKYPANPQWLLLSLEEIWLKISPIPLLFSLIFLLKYPKRNDKTLEESVILMLSVCFFIIWYLTLIGPRHDSTVYLGPFFPIMAIITSKELTSIHKENKYLYIVSTVTLFLYILTRIPLHWFYPLDMKYILRFRQNKWQYLSPMILISIYSLLVRLNYLKSTNFNYLLSRIPLRWFYPFYKKYMNRFGQMKRLYQKILIPILLFSLIIPGLMSIYITKAPLFYPLNREEIIKRNLGEDLYKTFEWSNDNIPENAKILTFETRLYYLEREVLPADSQLVKRIYQTDSLIEGLQTLKDLNTTHVMINPFWETHPLWYSSIIIRNINEKECFTLIYQSGEVLLFEIRYNWISN